MNYYIDLTIKPDSEMRESVLFNKVYAKFHKALVALSSNSIGISFPEYKVKLGHVFRIHGDSVLLQDLQKLNWLGGLHGYCHLSDVQKNPNEVRYRVISRIQSNMTQSKLNRLIKRNSISQEEIKLYKAKMFTKGLDNPYVEFESGSNGHRHRRYIQFGMVSDFPVAGEFDSFGLSKKATIPWF